MGTIRFEKAQQTNILLLDARQYSRETAFGMWRRGAAFKSMDDAIFVTKNTPDIAKYYAVYIICGKGVINVA